MCLHCIMNFPPLNPTNPDTPISLFAINGKFSMSLAYKHASFNPNHPNIGWLWKLKIPPKHAFFLWLTWWDRLPHRKLLHLRTITDTPNLPHMPYPNRRLHSYSQRLSNCKSCVGLTWYPPISYNGGYWHLGVCKFSLQYPARWLELENYLPFCVLRTMETKK